MYAIDDEPAFVEGNAVVFDVEEALGNRIEFGVDGPPRKVRLNGEWRTLFQ
ncbi:hypothetical protein PLCT1_00412 [Planctomycetaceae bacterium]|nr:hypothetical protein PLCT1_00412 [Planctomycetaceae bacterium]